MWFDLLDVLKESSGQPGLQTPHLENTLLRLCSLTCPPLLLSGPVRKRPWTHTGLDSEVGDLCHEGRSWVCEVLGLHGTPQALEVS